MTEPSGSEDEPIRKKITSKRVSIVEGYQNRNQALKDIKVGGVELKSVKPKKFTYQDDPVSDMKSEITL